MVQIRFWLNAFIPETVSGYTERLTTGPHEGKTAIPLPTVALVTTNIHKPKGTGYLSDQRSFSSDPAASVRMQSIASVVLRNGNAALLSGNHTSSGTTEVNIGTGAEQGYAVADMSRCRFSRLERRNDALSPNYPGPGDPSGPGWYMTVRGQAGDPLVVMAADIDYSGNFRIDLDRANPGQLTVSFNGFIDSFPAFEAYAEVGGRTQELFRTPPPPGNTVMNLLGRATRPQSGRAVFENALPIV